jgi:hypothetical protein
MGTQKNAWRDQSLMEADKDFISGAGFLDL